MIDKFSIGIFAIFLLLMPFGYTQANAEDTSPQGIADSLRESIMNPDEDQLRMNQLLQINHVFYQYIEAFYRENQRMPSNLAELLNSKWIILDPVPQSYTPGLMMVDRPLGGPDVDWNSIQLSFTTEGYVLNSYMFPPTSPTYGNHIWEAGRPEYIKWYTDGLTKVDPNDPLLSNDPVYIRQEMIRGIADELSHNYFIAHMAMPATFSVILDGKWAIKTENVEGLKPVPQNKAGWFYMGTVPEKSIVDIEYAVDEKVSWGYERLYMIDEELLRQGMVYKDLVLNGIVMNEAAVNKEETIPIIDSSLEGWGMAIN
jgi:hypothetical protein